MAAFNGENPNGTWTLEVVDAAGGDTGSINQWSIDIAALPVTPTFAPMTFTSSPGLAIADEATTTDALAISGATDLLCDLHVTTTITHTFNGDLELTVISPMGTRVALTTDNADTNANVFNGTLWDDTANAPVTEHVFTDGVTATPLTAEAALGAFLGENANGTWTLEIVDDAGLDTGTLASWSIEAIGCSCP
jgi:subtilisin-like proprotein convertase family protein